MYSEAIADYRPPRWVYSETIGHYRPYGWIVSDDAILFSGGGGIYAPPIIQITIDVYVFTIVYGGEMVFAYAFGIHDNELLMAFAREYTMNLMILLTDEDAEHLYNMQQAGIVEGFYSPFPYPQFTTWRVSSDFGYRIHPIRGTREFHSGIDIPKPAGTPIRAVAAGEVIESRWMGGFGNTVIIFHGDVRGDGASYRSLYAHNSRNLVRVGQRVQAGDVIAEVGTTGTSTGNHLHLEIIRNGVRQHPLSYIGPPP